MAGAVLGVIFGCALGASSLLLLDLEPSHKSIHCELEQILQDVLYLKSGEQSTTNKFAIPSDKCNVYFVGDRAHTISNQTENSDQSSYTRHSIDHAKDNQTVQDCAKSGTIVVQNDIISHQQDSDICHSVLCVPIIISNDQDVTAVVEFIRINPTSEEVHFTKSDVQLAQMLSHHVRIFLTKFVAQV